MNTTAQGRPKSEWPAPQLDSSGSRYQVPGQNPRPLAHPLQPQGQASCRQAVPVHLLDPMTYKSHTTPKPTHLQRPQWLLETQTMIEQIEPRADPWDTDSDCTNISKRWSLRHRHWLKQWNQEEKTLIALTGVEMVRQQCKNIFNTLKSNTAPPEPSSLTAGRPEYSNSEETKKWPWK